MILGSSLMILIYAHIVPELSLYAPPGYSRHFSDWLHTSRPFFDPVPKLQSHFLLLLGGKVHFAWTWLSLNSASVPKRSSMASARLSRASSIVSPWKIAKGFLCRSPHIPPLPGRASGHRIFRAEPGVTGSQAGAWEPGLPRIAQIRLKEIPPALARSIAHSSISREKT